MEFFFLLDFKVPELKRTQTCFVTFFYFVISWFMKIENYPINLFWDYHCFLFLCKFRLTLSRRTFPIFPSMSLNRGNIFSLVHNIIHHQLAPRLDNTSIPFSLK
jgi:hypothetical protein